MTDSCFTKKSLFEHDGYQPVSVGKRLRDLRTSCGYSIKTLAEMSGLAVNTLSLIENEKSSPSVSTLEQLAKAMGIPLTCFFEPKEEKQSVILTQQGQRQEMILGGIRVEDCGLDLAGQGIQPLIVTLSPGVEYMTDLIFHNGCEFVYCLSGQVDYFVDGEKYSLQAGDSLALNALLPHYWMNPGDEPAVYLLVMVPGETSEISGEIHFQTNP